MRIRNHCYMRTSFQIFLIGGIVVLFVVTGVLLMRNQDVAQNPIPDVENNGNGSGQVVTPIATSTQVRPAFLDRVEVTPDPQNPGLYFIGNTFTPDASYVIVYDSAAEFFNITLLKQPLTGSRIDAETYLEAILGVSRNSMCSLHYSVTVPYYVDETYTGKALGFSFCPGAVVIE